MGVVLSGGSMGGSLFLVIYNRVLINFRVIEVCY
jgi:hypothetical protein